MNGKSLYLLALCMMYFISSCDVHEWPDMPDKTRFVLRLDYSTEMTLWKFTYEDGRLTDNGLGDTYDSRLDSGRIRHIIRAYPLSDRNRPARDYYSESIFITEISGSYDCDLALDLPAGDYRIMVWSDFIHDVGDAYFYNPSNFSEITLRGVYTGDTDYRDAFRGVGEALLTTSVVEQPPTVLEIDMQRPLAKYEFISTDLQDFRQTNVDINDCDVFFFYNGFMPDSYDMTSDRPNDVSENISFESAPEQIDANSVSLGFDYVFVNGKQSGVHVMVGLYDAEGRQLALSQSIQVPLMRSRHTVIRGSFLMTQNSGGIRINPGFDGNYNIVIK